MTRVTLYIFILFLFAISCRSTNCAVDNAFVESFNKKLYLITELEKGSSPVSPEEYGYALIYLSKITGIVPRADYSSTLGYRNKDYYKEDLRKYREWLKKNKCRFSNSRADSIMHTNGY